MQTIALATVLAAERVAWLVWTARRGPARSVEGHLTTALWGVCVFGSLATILGLSAFYHDSGVVLLQDGRIVAAAQEERFTRKKHDFGFPRRAAEYCLREGGIATPNDLDYVVFYDKPLLKFERLLETYIRLAPRGVRSFVKAMPLWLKRKLWMREDIADGLGYEGTVLFTEHHEAHAASAFFPSPFERAAILTLDGVGEWATASVGIGEGNRIRILKELHFPHSLGLLYSAFTYFTGFRVNSGEYKMMGLAPYSEPRYADVILNELLDLKSDGSFKLPKSTLHRLENPGKIPLEIIEVQNGEYLGEDDIVRMDDVYGRHKG